MPVSKQTVPKPSESAPWYTIPKTQAVCVEHPCLVQNVDKAVDMLGGDKAIKNFLRKDHVEKPINLKFHPEDPFSQPILSVNCQTNNVLLKVTVPKRTGRKRKRGTTDPFVEDLNEPPAKKSANYLLESLRANKNTYQIEPIASVPIMHIFRTMPDFAYSTSHSQYLNQFRDKVLPFQYPLLSDFQLNPARGLEDTEIIPPSVLSTMAYPSNYAYRQNPAIKAFIDPTTGSRRLYNTQAPTKIHTQQCQWDTPPSEIPTTVSPSAPPLEAEPHNFRGLVTILRTIFARRPIWTRRGLANQLPPNAPIFLAKYAVGYAAYAMRSGPWRDTYIRFGVDPRSDPNYRKYQSLMLQLVSSKKSSIENRKYEEASQAWRVDQDKESHIFTGKGRVPADGKSWQLCDLQDPILKKLVDTPDLELRETCEERYFGWYQNGTWCKLKIILKAKIDLMLEEIVPDEGEEADFDRKFDRLLALPESFNVPAVPDEVRQRSNAAEDQYRRETPSLWKAAGRDGDPLLGFLPRNASKLELEWAAQYRALCRAPQGKLPIGAGRLSKSKAVTRGSFISESEDRGAAEDGEGSRVDVPGIGTSSRDRIETETRAGSGDSTENTRPKRDGAGVSGDGIDNEVGELELELEPEDEDEVQGEEEEEEEDKDGDEEELAEVQSFRDDIDHGRQDIDDEEDADALMEEASTSFPAG